MKRSAFTLIELIIYVAIAALVLVSVVTVGWNMIIDQEVIQGKSEVSSNARIVTHQLQNKIKQADDVLTGISTFDTNPSVLALDINGTTFIFDTYQKDVTVGGKETTITTLRTQNGTDPAVDLTSDSVNVTNFVLQNMTRGSEADNINIQLTIAKTNPGNDPTYDQSISVETAVSIRR